MSGKKQAESSLKKTFLEVIQDPNFPIGLTDVLLEKITKKTQGGKSTKSRKKTKDIA